MKRVDQTETVLSYNSIGTSSTQRRGAVCRRRWLIWLGFSLTLLVGKGAASCHVSMCCGFTFRRV